MADQSMTLSIRKSGSGYAWDFKVSGDMDVKEEKMMLDTLRVKGLELAEGYYQARLNALEIHRLEERIAELYELCEETDDPSKIHEYGKEILDLREIIKKKNHEQYANKNLPPVT